MTVRYAQHVNKRVTAQSEPIPGEQQVKNYAGGYVRTAARSTPASAN
jgi:hypothetical protein